MLSTVIPLAVGGTLLRVRPNDRSSNTVGLAVGGAGLLVGPSMGQWCLGGEHARKSGLYTIARIAGMGGVALVVEWGKQELAKAGLLALPISMIYVGVAIGIAGAAFLKTVSWTIEETPRRVCNKPEPRPTVSVSPVVGSSGDPGVQLSIRF